MSWQAVALIVAAFAAAFLLGWLQHRAYARTVNQVAEQEHRSGMLLVTGRAKGVLRGAVVLLVVDRDRQHVVRALAMQGASVFARFRERPELTGPLAGVNERVRGKALRAALADALPRYRRLAASTARRRST
jgi:glucitol operon activator protein